MTRYTTPVWGLAAALALTLGNTAHADLAPPRLLKAETKKPVIIVGVLTKQADKKCTGKPDPEWINEHFQVGFTRIANSQVDLEPFVGKIVAVTGAPLHHYVPPPIVHTGQCMVPQMRSDWVEGPGGMRVKRLDGGVYPAFAVRKVEVHGGVQIRKSGDDVRVAFTNHTGRDLENVKVHLHYEGCYGKPGTIDETKGFPVVKPGEEVIMSFPALERREGAPKGRADHAAHAVSVEGSGDNLRVGIETSLPFRVPCPERR